MNEYKIVLDKDKFVPEIIKADEMKYEDGFILFYINGELIASVFAPDTVIKKPAL